MNHYRTFDKVTALPGLSLLSLDIDFVILCFQVPRSTFRRLINTAAGQDGDHESDLEEYGDHDELLQGDHQGDGDDGADR